MRTIGYEVPAYSQYVDVKNKRWRDKACGIVALYQVLEYFLGRGGVGTLAHFIQLGVKQKAYSPRRGGWVHKGLVDIAKAYGIETRAHDVTREPTGQALSFLITSLKRGPVLVSIHKDFNPQKGGHLIVVTGYQKKGTSVVLFYNEPASRTRKGIKRRVTQRAFERGWKKRFIAFHASNITPLFFDNYFAAIKKSAGSKMFQSVFVRKDGKKLDITKRGELSCAVYVSSILAMFNLISDRHATVRGTLHDMEQTGWHKIKKPKPGALLVWGPWEKSTHQHIGFYIGSARALSNNATKGVPTRHHWTFGTRGGKPKRKVVSMWWHAALDTKAYKDYA